MLDVLRRRDFALLWLAGLISVAGDWVLNAALPYFVYQRTGSTVATAAMIVAELVPGVLLGSVAGVFVDRWNRKWVMAAANVLQALVVAMLLLFANGDQLWVVYAVAVLAASIASFADPAENALLPNLVGSSDLVAANSLNALNNRLGRLIGLPLGASLVVALGLPAVIVVDAVSFLLAAGLVMLIATPADPRSLPSPQPEDASETAGSALATLWAEWVDGLRLIRQEHSIALVFVILGLMTYGGTMLDPTYPAWVRDVLSAGPAVYALLMTVHAVGGICGSVLIGTLGKTLTPRQLMGWGSLVAGALLLVKFNVPSVVLAMVLSLFGGVCSVAGSVGVDTLIMQVIPDRYRGRVFGALGASGALLSLLGAMTGGLVAQLIGVLPALNLASGLVLLAGAIVLVAYARPGTRQPDEVTSAASR